MPAFSPLPLDPGDPGQPKTKLGRVDGSEAGAERRLLRDGMQVLGPWGAGLSPSARCRWRSAGSCPPGGGCIAASATTRPRRASSCAEDVYDTLANEVYLVARVA